jgi:hypothetical protein
MTSTEIREEGTAMLAKFHSVADRDHRLEYGAPELAIYKALMEIAAQLAEMNERREWEQAVRDEIG